MSQSFTTASDKITKLVINSGHFVFENIHSKQGTETIKQGTSEPSKENGEFSSLKARLVKVMIRIR